MLTLPGFGAQRKGDLSFGVPLPMNRTPGTRHRPNPNSASRPNDACSVLSITYSTHNCTHTVHRSPQSFPSSPVPRVHILTYLLFLYSKIRFYK